mgnify:FL=1
MKLSFRASVGRVLIYDALLVALAFSIAILFPATRDEIFIPAGVFLSHLMLYAPVGFFKGFGFVLHDEPEDSPVNYYHYFILVFS